MNNAVVPGPEKKKGTAERIIERKGRALREKMINTGEGTGEKCKALRGKSGSAGER